MKIRFRFILILAILIPLTSCAGWVITGRYIDREGNTIFKRYFIQDNQIKVERYNLLYSCNLKTGEIILVDPVNLVFVKTNYNAYSTRMKEIKLKRLNELLALIPEDQQPGYKQKYTEQAGREVYLPVYPADSLLINQVADTVKLLGYKTAKYVITEKGRKKEEFFFARQVDISADIDMKEFLKYVYLLEPEDKTISYLASDAYLNLTKNGLVLRRFMYEDGYRTEWQVNMIDTKTIPSYEFGTPDLCKEVTLDKWLTRGKNTDDTYYDDYE